MLFSNSVDVNAYLNAILFIEKKQVVFSATSVCYIKPDNFTILCHTVCKRVIILKKREAQTNKNQSATKLSPPNLLFGRASRNRSPYTRIPRRTVRFLFEQICLDTPSHYISKSKDIPHCYEINWIIDLNILKCLYSIASWYFKKK